MDIKKICESVKRKRVIRGGKVKRKWSSDRPGYKMEIDSRTHRGKEVRMTPEEIRHRMVASRIRTRKMKSMTARITRKRNISMMKRKGWK